jgi:hypothetical protein
LSTSAATTSAPRLPKSFALAPLMSLVSTRAVKLPPCAPVASHTAITLLSGMSALLANLRHKFCSNHADLGPCFASGPTLYRTGICCLADSEWIMGCS